MKLALYRKYRPTSFADVVGQENVIAALRNQLAAGRFGHAYLFTGVRGTGKTTLAKIVAKAVNCPHAQQGEPCGECEICRGIDNGSILDVTEIDAASNNRVDDVRGILEESSYAPAVCRMRVYIVDEVHMLSMPAFNALLKTLEEPPAHVLFVLATTEIQKVPATILSRCQRFDLKRIPEEKIAARLKYVAAQENIALTDDAASLIARLADGALRDALSILDTTASLGGEVDEETVKRLAGVSDREYLFRLSDAVVRGDLTVLMTTLQQLYSDSAEPSRLLNELIRHYRNLLMVRVGRVTLKDCSAAMQARYERESGGFDDAHLLTALSVLADAAESMSRSLDREITLELALLKLAGGGLVSVPAPAAMPRAAAPAVRQPAAAPAAKPAAPAEAKPAPVQDDLPPWETAPLPEEAPPLPEAEPVKRPAPAAAQPAAAAPQPVPAAVPAANDLLAEWPQVVAAVREKSKMLGTLLAKSSAHVTDTHLLIEASEMAMKFIRENADSRQYIKDAVLQVSGLRLPVGPWKAPAAAAPKADGDDGLEEFLRRAEQAGVEVNRK